MKTKSDMQFAADYVKKLSGPVRMLIAEAFIDLFINSNPSFNLRRFLAAAEITETEWNQNRVPMPTIPKNETTS